MPYPLYQSVFHFKIKNPHESRVLDKIFIRFIITCLLLSKFLGDNSKIERKCDSNALKCDRVFFIYSRRFSIFSFLYFSSYIPSISALSFFSQLIYNRKLTFLHFITIYGHIVLYFPPHLFLFSIYYLPHLVIFHSLFNFLLSLFHVRSCFFLFLLLSAFPILSYTRTIIFSILFPLITHSYPNVRTPKGFEF